MVVWSCDIAFTWVLAVNIKTKPQIEYLWWFVTNSYLEFLEIFFTNSRFYSGLERESGSTAVHCGSKWFEDWFMIGWNWLLLVTKWLLEKYQNSNIFTISNSPNSTLLFTENIFSTMINGTFGFNLSHKRVEIQATLVQW